jgi:hypothetical protein
MPAPVPGGFGCISTATGDQATSQALDTLLAAVPTTVTPGPGQLFVTLSGPITWTQGIAANPALDLQVFAVGEGGAVDLDIFRFGVPEVYSAADVGCGGATQPGASCNFSLTLPLGALSIIIPPDQGSAEARADFTFFDAAGSSYFCQKPFTVTN